MSLSEKLELLINADPSQGIAAMDRFAKATDKSITSAESTLKRFSSSALKVGGAGIGVGGLLTELGSKEQAAGQQLSAAVGQVGQSLDEYDSRIERTVEEQTRFGNTAPEVKAALTTLTLAYNDTGKALDEMQLVADLAARKHIDLAAAASIVAKAHGGSAKVFREFGIQVKANADGTKDYDGALSDLSVKLKGQASAAADTWGGRLNALKANVENFVGTFGEKFGPAILGVSTGLTALGAITSGVSAIQGRFAASNLAAAGSADAAAAAVDVETGSLVAETAAAEAATVATFALVAAPLAVGAAFAYGVTHAESFTLSLQGLQDPVGDVTRNLDRIQAAANLTGTSLYDVGKQMAETSIPAALAFADGLDREGKSSRDVRQAIDDLTGSTENGTNATVNAAEAEKNLAAQLSETTKQLDTQRAAQDSLLGSRISADEANLNYTDSLNKILVAQAAANTATGVDALTAQEDLKKAVLASASAAEQLAQKTADQAIAQDAANGRTDSAAQKSQIQRDALKNLADQLSPDSPLRKYLDEYIYTLNSIPGQKDTVLSAHYDVNTQPTTAHTSPRAAGGPVMGGSSYLIGENGPEVVTFGASGFVTPNDKLGKGTGHTFVLAGNAEEQAAAVSRRLRIDAMLSRL